RNRAGGGVPIAVEIDENLATRNVQNVQSISDADIGLMRNEQVHVVDGKIRVAQNVLNRIDENADGPAKNRTAIHAQVMHIVGKKLRGGREPAATGGAVEEGAAAAVSAEAVANDSLIRPAGRQQHCPGAVTEERIGFEVRWIDDSRVAI